VCGSGTLSSTPCCMLARTPDFATINWMTNMWDQLMTCAVCHCSTLSKKVAVWRKKTTEWPHRIRRAQSTAGARVKSAIKKCSGSGNFGCLGSPSKLQLWREDCCFVLINTCNSAIEGHRPMHTSRAITPHSHSCFVPWDYKTIKSSTPLYR
jgi:hypothetical protein